MIKLTLDRDSFRPCSTFFIYFIQFYLIQSTFMIRLELWQDDKTHSGEEPSADAAVALPSLDFNLPPPPTPVIFCRSFSPTGIFVTIFCHPFLSIYMTLFRYIAGHISPQSIALG